MICLQRDYPRQLHIGENIWDIRFCRIIPGHGPNTLGLCDPSELIIYIKMGQTPRERFKTFAHEICHAVCFEFNIKENHAIIHKLEEPIVRLLMDNGVIF